MTNNNSNDINAVFLTSDSAVKEQYKAILSSTADAICDAVNDTKSYVGPTPDELKKQVAVDEMLPSEGLGWNKTFERIKKQILPNFLRTSSTDYMAHLHSASLLETIASELIISTFNQSMDSWDQSPVATEIEVQVIEYLCRMYGYGKESDGVFTSGGSQSNQTAIILARDWFCNEKLKYDVKKFGLPPQFSKMRLYTSEISHFSMEKSAHILGLGYQSVVKVPVNAKKQMDIAAFKKLVEDDIAAGNIPFCVVATVGTTDFGSIDNIDEIRAVADSCGMWVHADAAYGSGVIMSQKYQSLVAALRKCDSITVDFHKMFMMPISASAVLVKDGAAFDALTIHADYLNRTEDEEDGYTNLVDKSLQTTRRFDALKVWVSFQMRGRNGWSDLITTCMDNARYVYSCLAADPDFAPVTDPEISSVVFRLSPEFCTKNAGPKVLAADDVNKKVRRLLIHQEGVVIGQTVSDGAVCLKFTLLNPLVTHEKLDQLLGIIKKLGLQVLASGDASL